MREHTHLDNNSEKTTVTTNVSICKNKTAKEKRILNKKEKWGKKKKRKHIALHVWGGGGDGLFSFVVGPPTPYAVAPVGGEGTIVTSKSRPAGP